MSMLPAEYPADALAAFELLKSRQSLSIDDMKVLAMIENFGECFYQAIARGVPNDEAKALLHRSGQEERGHAARLVKAIKLKGGSFELPSDKDNPFLQAAPQLIPSDADFMNGLAQGEMDGDLQYQTWADAEPNPEVAKLLRQNGKEETRHGERIAQVKKLLAMS
jgi:rubrerythrin